MLFAHMPAGYLLGAVIARRWPQAMTPAAWGALLLGSVAPDFDWLYFYFISDHSINHHDYLRDCHVVLVERAAALAHHLGYVLCWLVFAPGARHHSWRHLVALALGDHALCADGGAAQV
jgi:hypothetical protein